jgi:serine/threonine protein kinase
MRHGVTCEQGEGSVDQVSRTEERALGSEYVLGERIGHGAVSEVFRARVRNSGLAVAVKILKPELSSNPRVVAQFIQERSILTAINNTHIVRVIGMIVERSTLGIVMELIDGENLRRYLQRNGPFSPAFAVRLIDQIIQGVIAIHEAGIVHRDLKPENILVETHDDSGAESINLKISDFGLADIYSQSSIADVAAVGTLHYMAPEVIQGVGASPASDMYSVGVIFYEMLSGLPPFADSQRWSEVQARQLEEEPRRIVEIPENLWQLINSLLAIDPAARPSATEISAELRVLQPLANVPAVPRPPGSRITRSRTMRETSVSFEAVPPREGTSSDHRSLFDQPEIRLHSVLESTEFARHRTRRTRYLGSRHLPSPDRPITEEDISHSTGVMRRYNFGRHEFLLVDVLNNALTLNWTTDVSTIEFAELILEQISADESGSKITVSVRGVMGDLEAKLGATMVIAGSQSFNDQCEFIRFDDQYITIALQVLPSNSESMKVFGISAHKLSLDMVFPLIVRTATREIVAHTLRVGSDSFSTRLSTVLDSHEYAVIGKGNSQL